ncbi:MAG TPA: APC family permease [Thermomicrobiales bacterium]|nr:APC family permease [Thermomicrobiales bacterium]
MGRDMSMAAPALARKLTTADAVVIGLGSMIGAGIFSVFGPAAEVAGNGLLVGLLVAAVIAYCNATASAQLAAAYPSAGGTYLYGNERLGAWWGFAAGWMFVVGKTASCAAMALTIAHYALPDFEVAGRLLGLVVVAGLTWANCRGITRTAQLTKVLVTCSLTALAIVVLMVLFRGEVSTDSLTSGSWFAEGPYAILQSAGLIFFAFAGYARIATMGEEVINPRIAIPRAITIAFLLTVVIYVVVAVTSLIAAGATALAESEAPLLTVVEEAGVGQIGWIVRVGGFVAATGALLGLMAGIGRTSLAMARHGDFPSRFARVDPAHQVPVTAQVAIGCIVGVLLLVADLRNAIGFSSFGVLLYYAVTNAAAWTQPAEDRRYPKWLQAMGLVGCLVLALTLPLTAVIVGILVLAVGLGVRWWRLRAAR